MKTFPLSRQENLVVQELNGELMIYNLTENKAFCLNKTCAAVWQLCDGKKTISEISYELGKVMKYPANEDIVWFTLDQLKKENLIENDLEKPDYFLGLSRRDLIKKVGLGTMIALPVISSIVAPQSIMAQSCAPLLGGCTVTSNCCPGFGLTCNSGLCCDGAGFIGTTPANIPNPIGNCGAAGAGARTAACDAACCSAAASGSVFACTASTLTCQCV